MLRLAEVFYNLRRILDQYADQFPLAEFIFFERVFLGLPIDYPEREFVRRLYEDLKGAIEKRTAPATNAEGKA